MSFCLKKEKCEEGHFKYPKHSSHTQKKNGPLKCLNLYLRKKKHIILIFLISLWTREALSVWYQGISTLDKVCFQQWMKYRSVERAWRQTLNSNPGARSYQLCSQFPHLQDRQFNHGTVKRIKLTYLEQHLTQRRVLNKCLLLFLFFLFSGDESGAMFAFSSLIETCTHQN